MKLISSSLQGADLSSGRTTHSNATVQRESHKVRRSATALVVAAASLLSACGSGGGGGGGEGASLAAMPSSASSTKFIPTFLVYYGGGPTLVSADAAKLAKYDMLDVDRSRYNSIGSNTWSAIKAINPNSQIYLYEMGAETPSYQDNAQQVEVNGLARHNVSRGHPMGSLNGNQPGLFQKDAAGNRIYSSAYSNPSANEYWYLMDFGSSAYQSYWLTSVKADIVDQPWAADGIFVDNCVTTAAAAGYNATSVSYPTDAAWSNAMNSFVVAITAGMHGYGQRLWCNKGGTGSDAGGAAWRALDSSAHPPDVLLEEGAFAVEWGSDTQFFPEADWRRQIDTMGAIRNSRVAMMSHTQLSEGQSGTDNWGDPVTFWQTLSYAMGSFLLGKNAAANNSYFMFNGGSGYNKIWWFDEYDKLDMGKPLGNYTMGTINGVNVYSREFEKGYVYVNPTASNVASVPLPQAVRQVTHDNLSSALNSLPVVTSISLNGHCAAFLMKG
ncbi:MAG TPA: putative glycoside hydrolase [Pyrinomonadaceae bacterium]|nr:putative glycoside hydrolase [Pyrinomonadaceae bacterium]